MNFALAFVFADEALIVGSHFARRVGVSTFLSFSSVFLIN